MSCGNQVSEESGSISLLRSHALSGICSVIRYQKGCGKAVERVIEPTHLIPGFDSVMIRGLQREPSMGMRLLSPAGLVVVAPSDIRRSVSSAAFVSEDLAKLQSAVHRASTAAEQRIASYVSAVRRVISDLTLEDDEAVFIEQERERLGVSLSEMRAAHAVVFGELLRAFSSDWAIDASEEEQLERALRCLDELGWAPQT
jgi:hypothetical protein